MRVMKEKFNIFSLLRFYNVATMVTSFDFDLIGERAAVTSHSGVCLVSEIDTNSCSFQMNIGVAAGNEFTVVFAILFSLN